MGVGDLVSNVEHGRRRGRGESPLTWQKARFALLYLRYGQQRRAAIEAGAAPKSAHVQASRWMGQRCVRDFIHKAMARRAEELHIDATWVLRELVGLYKTSFADLLGLEQLEDGTWRITRQFDLDNAPPEVLARVSKMAIKPDGTIIVELPDPLAVLEKIGKHINVSAFEDRMVLEQRTAEQQVEALVKGRERVAQMRLVKQRKVGDETDAA